VDAALDSTAGARGRSRSHVAEFYYDQEDLVRERQKARSWSSTIFRPGGAICSVSLGTPMNLLSAIVVYAAICCELGLPLRFPSPDFVYRSLYQLTSAELLARASIWAGESLDARNELFNVTNGDTFRWQHMWPHLAKMETAEPVPFPLTVYMADKEPVWDAILKREKLQPIPYEKMASWDFGDFVFRQGFDNVSITIKVRQAGFHDCIDSEATFAALFEQMRGLKLMLANMRAS
jgi:hypothetical protein